MLYRFCCGLLCVCDRRTFHTAALIHYDTDTDSFTLCPAVQCKIRDLILRIDHRKIFLCKLICQFFFGVLCSIDINVCLNGWICRSIDTADMNVDPIVF